MILTKSDCDDKIVAYVDYELVDKDGRHTNLGEYVYIRWMWVHESIRNTNMIEYFAKMGMERHPNVKYFYYNRKKYKDRIKMFKLKEF